MFISFYRKDTPMCEEVSHDIEELNVTFKKELFQFGNTNDIIIVVREHEKGKVVCVCKVFMDLNSYKIEKINYKKQLGLIFCLEWLRTSIIMENFEMFKSEQTEIKIFWNKSLFKDNVIEQIAKLVDLYPNSHPKNQNEQSNQSENEFYIIDYKNYMCYSGNNIDLKKDKNVDKPFSQNGLSFGLNNQIKSPKYEPFKCKPFGFNKQEPFGLNKQEPFGFNKQEPEPFGIKDPFGLNKQDPLNKNKEDNNKDDKVKNIFNPPSFGANLPPVMGDLKKQSDENKKDDNFIFGDNKVPVLFDNSNVKDLKI